MTRRSLGQHYLVDPAVVERIVGLAAVAPDERVLEVGTGKGILSKELAGLGSSFVGYEVDARNAEETRRLIDGRGDVHLADAFKETPRFDVLVSSLPYSRSASFVEWLGGLQYDRAVVVLQEDFVSKILAKPGSRNYRAISVISQVSAFGEVVANIPKSAFSPQPRVNSQIVRFRPRTRISRREVSLVKKLFSLRRRKVASVAKEFGFRPADSQSGDRRVNSLEPEEALEICRAGVAARC